MSPTELKALRTLRTDPNLVIRPADKGGRWVVMDREKYRAECLRQLNDATFYQPLPAPLEETSDRISAILQDLLSQKYISRKEFLFLLPSSSPRPRRFSVLPKIHKPHLPGQMPPGRPIISDVDTNSSAVARFIEFHLNPLARSLPSHLTDTFHFVAKLRNLSLEPHTVFCTLDVRSLYTSIPIEEGIRRVHRAFCRHPNPNRPDLQLLELLRISLAANDFLFEDTFYLQSSGVAMGKTFGGSFANIYMGEWERDALASSPWSPRAWLRYQDDIFFLWDDTLEELTDFLCLLNSRDPNIQLDLHSSANAVRYLDLEVFRSGCGTIGHRVAFKATDSHLVLPKSSHHPTFTHRGVLYSQILRWAVLCSSKEDFQRACATVFPIWRNQSVTRSALRFALNRVNITTGFSNSWRAGFHKCNSPRCRACALADERSTFTANGVLYPILHHTTCESRGCIYAIRCVQCHVFYIGQTGNSFRHRLSQHLRNIRNPDSETFVSHHFQAHNVNSSLRFFVIERCPSKTKRLRKEALWIRRFDSLAPGGLNISPGQESPTVNLVTFRAPCTSNLNNAIKNACEEATKLSVRLAYRTDKNLRNTLF